MNHNPHNAEHAWCQNRPGHNRSLVLWTSYVLLFRISCGARVRWSIINVEQAVLGSGPGSLVPFIRPFCKHRHLPPCASVWESIISVFSLTLQNGFSIWNLRYDSLKGTGRTPKFLPRRIIEYRNSRELQPNCNVGLVEVEKVGSGPGGQLWNDRMPFQTWPWGVLYICFPDDRLRSLWLYICFPYDQLRFLWLSQSRNMYIF